MPNLREKCGIFGVFAPGEDVARLTFFGIHALQHRGQESAGIAATDGRNITMRGGMGLVSQVFTEDHLEDLEGLAAIGHTRYSTTGASIECNTQPLVVTDQGDHRPLRRAPGRPQSRNRNRVGPRPPTMERPATGTRCCWNR